HPIPWDESGNSPAAFYSGSIHLRSHNLSSGPHAGRFRKDRETCPDSNISVSFHHSHSPGVFPSSCAISLRSLGDCKVRSFFFLLKYMIRFRLSHHISAPTPHGMGAL